MSTRSSTGNQVRMATVVLAMTSGLLAGMYPTHAAAEAAPTRTGTIKVTKAIDPVSDEGRFDLTVGDTVVRAGAGHGDFGLATLPAGTYLVSETATNRPLSDYRRTVSCAKNGADYVANPTDSSVEVSIRSGDIVDCTITNTRKVATALTVTWTTRPIGCGPLCFWNTYEGSVLAVNGEPVDDGTVAFRSTNGYGCSAAVNDGRAVCVYPGSMAPASSAYYSGSDTFAPSTWPEP